MSYNDLLYVFGGYTNDSAPSDELWCFDLGQRMWSLAQVESKGAPAYVSVFVYVSVSVSVSVSMSVSLSVSISVCVCVCVCVSVHSVRISAYTTHFSNRPRYFHTAFIACGHMYLYGGKVAGKPTVRAPGQRSSRHVSELTWAV